MRVSSRCILRLFPLCTLLLMHSGAAWAQGSAGSRDAEIEELRQAVHELSQRVTVLEEQLKTQQAQRTEALPQTSTATQATTALIESVSAVGKSGEVKASQAAAEHPAEDPPANSQSKALPWQLPGGATLNYMFDGYYGYNFNHPLGRVNYLRAYDVLSNAFSINQASVAFDLDPDVATGRRYGVRLDLQYGQATETLQGNSVNEPRPDIYRNIFQVYGTYVFPLGQGWTVDVGKWSSSLGIEGNYTKDQMNYTRSFYFNFLPFYHMGVRSNYKINEKLALNYWIVNGTQQSEPTNSFKDQLFGYVLTPRKNISWTMNYYVGQEHPDSVPATGCKAPVQPGLCLAPVNPAPDGKLHIFDSYVTWNPAEKWSAALEGDYVIEREWTNAGPGMSSAPSHVDGGAAYARYQWTPKMALAARTEYLSDRGGLFSGTTQALKEFTGTYEYRVAEGLLTRVEYRRDWTNVPFFLTNKPGELAAHQTTATVGLVWWYGGKQGAW